VREPRSGASSRARRALESELTQAELELPAWSGDALLLIRTVDMRVRRRGTAEGATGVGAALRERVWTLGQHAVRPVRGRLPPSVQAVIFSDWAEALAVFALSATERRAAGEWWWRLLWSGVDSTDWVTAWIRNAGEMPGAAVALAR